MLEKLKLGQKFPKSLLCIRKSFLRVGLIELEIVLVMATLKIYIGNKRVKRNSIKAIRINEEIVKANSSFNKSWDKIDENDKRLRKFD